MNKKTKEQIVLEYAQLMNKYDIARYVKKIKKYLKINNQDKKSGIELEKAILYGWDEIIDSY